jgi:hypothetical protein
MTTTSEIRQCLHCHIDVRVPHYRLKTFRFCSRKCAWHWQNLNMQVPKVCAICDNVFTVIACRQDIAKYCSRDCFHEAMRGRGRTTYTCHHCDKQFMGSKAHNRKYCSRKCTQKAHHSVWNPAFTTVRKALAARGAILKCEGCSYDTEPSILGIHHKDGNRKNNELSNLAVLCPNCHSLQHRKHIAH